MSGGGAASGGGYGRKMEGRDAERRAILTGFARLHHLSILTVSQYFFLRGVASELHGTWDEQELTRAHTIVCDQHIVKGVLLTKSDAFVERARAALPTTEAELRPFCALALNGLLTDRELLFAENVLYVFVAARDKPDLLTGF